MLLKNNVSISVLNDVKKPKLWDRIEPETNLSKKKINKRTRIEPNLHIVNRTRNLRITNNFYRILKHFKRFKLNKKNCILQRFIYLLVNSSWPFHFYRIIKTINNVNINKLTETQSLYGGLMLKVNFEGCTIITFIATG